MGGIFYFLSWDFVITWKEYYFSHMTLFDFCLRLLYDITIFPRVILVSDFSFIYALGILESRGTPWAICFSQMLYTGFSLHVVYPI